MNQAIAIFNDRELNTVLHALRQFAGGCTRYECDHFAEVDPLTPTEVDALAERLQLAPEQPVLPHAIVTIIGGVGEVAETTGAISVDILDYDNVKATLYECEASDPPKRDLQLTPVVLAFIRKHEDAEFVERVEAALTLECWQQWVDGPGPKP